MAHNVDVMFEIGDTAFFFMDLSDPEVGPEYPVLVGGVIVEVDEAHHEVHINFGGGETQGVDMDNIVDVMTWEENMIGHLPSYHYEE